MPVNDQLAIRTLKPKVRRVRTAPGDSRDDIARDLHERALAARREARLAEACDLFGQLVPLAREYAEANYLAWVLRAWGDTAVFTGNDDVALPAIEEAIGLCQHLGDGTGHSHCVFLLGQIAADQGRADDAEALFVRSLEISQQVGDHAGVAKALQSRGEIAAWRGEPARAATMLLEARRTFVAIADRCGEASVLQELARVEVALGRIQSARKCLEDALELAETLGNAQVKALVLFHVGMFCADWHGAEEAEAALNEALPLFRQTGDRLGQARCHAALATTHWRLHKHDEASKTLATAREIHVEMGNVREAAVVSAQMAGVLVAQGKCAAGVDLYREHMETIRRHCSVAAQGEALLGLGEALGRGGDLCAARDPFTEARTLFSSVGDQSNLAHADMIEGEVLIRAGREAEGVAMIRRGLDKYDALGVLGPERPETLVPKAVARIKREMCPVQDGN